MCCAPSIPIQDRGDPCIGFDSRQLANYLDEVVVGNIPMSAAANFRELYLGVISALPMHHEAYDLFSRRGDDLFQSDSQEPLLEFRRTARIIPESG